MKAGDIGDGQLGTLDYTIGPLAGGWTGLSIPLSQYYDPDRLTSIRISFNAGNTGDNQYPSGVFIDGTSLSENNLYQVVPVPPAALLLGSGLIGLVGLRRRMGSV